MRRNDRTPVTRWLLAMAAAGGVLAGIIVAINPPEETSPGSAAPAGQASAPPAAPPVVAPADTKCANVISSLSSRQQLAQLLVVGMSGDNPQAAAQQVGAEQLGGIFLDGNGTAILQNGALDQVRHAAKLPVSVAADEEGGRVQRIDMLDGSIPSARQMAATMPPEQVRKLAADRGRQLSARGVTVDYAPDADVSDQPDKGAIGDRSYSPRPELVRAYAQAFAEGLREGGVQPILKHFPGHGRAVGDSHEGLISTPPIDDLREHDLVPYQQIEGFGEVGVMVGHLSVPGLTGGDPASISPAAYQMLRKDYRFTGPVITDDLGAMKAITDRYPLPEAVLKALQAGADQALWSSGGRSSQVLDRLEKALSSGELTADHVRDSLVRVLSAKKAC